MRPSGRAVNELRAVALETDFAKYAEGSCLGEVWRYPCPVHGERRRFGAAVHAQQRPGLGNR